MRQRSFYSIMAIAMSVGMINAEVSCLKVEAAEPAQQAEAGVHLSADRFEIEVGEIYLFEITSKIGMMQDDWKIEEIKFSQPDVLKVLRPDEIPVGTVVKKYAEQGEVEFGITDQFQMKPTQFFVIALKSGTVEIEVAVSDASGKVITLTYVSENLPKGTKAARKLEMAEKFRRRQEEARQEETADTGDYTVTNLSVPAARPNSSGKPSNTGHNNDTTTTNPAEPDKPTNPEEPNKPVNPDDPTNPDKPPVEQEDDEIEDWLDLNSTSLTYNGEIQKPIFNKLPSGYTIEGLTGNTNAGTYTEEIVVRDADNRIVKTAAVNYVIHPSVIEIKHLYNAEDGVVLTDISGLVEADVLNIEGVETADVSKAGRYQISTNIEIDEEKIANYILADGQTSVGKTDAYNVVGNNPWFEVLMDYSISDDNSQLAVNFYLKNLRTEQVGANAERPFILDLCIYYDEEVLSYDAYNEYNDWRVDTVNPNGHKQTYVPDISSGPVSVAPDLTVFYTGRCHVLAGNGTTTKMCSLTYNIKDGNIEELTNSVITIDQINFDAYNGLTNSEAENDIPARYWADPTSIVINPDGSIEEHDIVAEIDPLENNLTPNRVCSPGEFENIKDELRDYMDEYMTETKDLTPSDPLPTDNTAVTVTNDPAQDTEFAKIPDRESIDEASTEEPAAESVQNHIADDSVSVESAETPDASAGTESAELPDASAGNESAETPDASAGAESAELPDASAGAESAETPDASAGAESAETPDTSADAESAELPDASAGAESVGKSDADAGTKGDEASDDEIVEVNKE